MSVVLLTLGIRLPLCLAAIAMLQLAPAYGALTVPNHLVLTLTVDGANFSVCLVDLTNLGGADPAAYAIQLQALRTWAGQQNGPAVIMGTFNDERRKLPPLFSVNERLGWPATELGNRGRDYIFCTRDLARGEIIAPPYGAPRPKPCASAGPTISS